MNILGFAIFFAVCVLVEVVAVWIMKVAIEMLQTERREGIVFIILSLSVMIGDALLVIQTCQSLFSPQ